MNHKKIFTKNDEKQKVFTWQSNWISQLESPWSIFEKFRYLNSITNREFFNNFCLKELKRPAGFIANKHKDLITLSAFDKTKLLSAFNIDLIKFNNENLERLLDVQNKYIGSYLDQKLHYCPICIKNGFHSLLHQYKELEYCPYHDVRLQNACENCERHLPYQIDEKYNREPFKCICGLNLLIDNNNLVITEWKTLQLNEIRNQKIITWLNYENISLRQFLFNHSIKTEFEKLFN
ncbi:hypothetical protein KUV80_03880 [Fictibacillus nanhaiensis]|uniref:hypothetical protein n=1 Tax=Fictibacillus nanhaiensis TaxID=742169 RepID=UPI001C96B1AE|nr:hypothetical protein [Fictibacillus nanhaiensis]MBY6035773.1 hypothetical protein [Fictibacillus nanhaiensis]